MKHPYEEFENTDTWKIVEKALAELEENQDIEFTTKTEYVIGYLCKQLLSKNDA